MTKFILGLVVGLFVAALIAYLNLLLLQSSGFDLSQLVLFFVLPAGALFLGAPAAFCFNFIAWTRQPHNSTSVLKAAVLFFVSIALGALTIFFFHLAMFADQGLLSEGNSFGEAFAFYFSNLSLDSRFGEYSVGERGLWIGYLSYVAAAFGGIVGLAGLFASPAFQVENASQRAAQFATLAALLAKADGEIDEDEIICGKYLVELALDEMLRESIGISRHRKKIISSQIYDQAKEALDLERTFLEIADQCITRIATGESKLNHLLAFGLVSIIARDDLDEMDKRQLSLFAYIYDKLELPKKDGAQLLAVGMTMKQQLLRGELK